MQVYTRSPTGCHHTTLHPFNWRSGTRLLPPGPEDHTDSWEEVLVARSLSGDVYVAPVGSVEERNTPCQFCPRPTVAIYRASLTIERDRCMG